MSTIRKNEWSIIELQYLGQSNLNLDAVSNDVRHFSWWMFYHCFESVLRLENLQVTLPLPCMVLWMQNMFRSKTCVRTIKISVALSDHLSISCDELSSSLSFTYKLRFTSDTSRSRTRNLAYMLSRKSSSCTLEVHISYIIIYFAILQYESCVSV